MLALRALAVAAGFLAACAGEDPDRRIADGGVLAAGFRARLDDPDATLADVRLVAEDGGYTARNGPNVVLWRPEDRADGRYALTAVVEHLDSHGHHHGAGIFFGGTDLDGPAQRYTYFLVHGGGRFLIKRRDGATTHDVATWRSHPAIATDEAGAPRNELRVEVGADETRFLVNGSEVFRSPTAGLHTDGVLGYRMVHNLEVRFSTPRVESSP